MSANPPTPAAARALESALAEVKPTLVRVLKRYRIREEDAKDVLQEVYISFLRKFASIGDPAGWLIGALRRECLHFRRRSVQRLYDAVDSTLLEVLATPAEESTTQQALLSEVLVVLESIREPCRTMLVLRYRLGCERSEVADQLGYASLESARSAERRCVALLAQKLTRAGRHLVDGGPVPATQEVAHG